MDYMVYIPYVVAAASFLYALALRFKVKEVETILRDIEVATSADSEGGVDITPVEALRIVSAIVKAYNED